MIINYKYVAISDNHYINMAKFTASTKAIEGIVNTINNNANDDTCIKFRICAYCNNSTIDKLLQCSDCKFTYYCDSACQKKDWSLHKSKCQQKKKVHHLHTQLHKYCESITDNLMPYYDHNVKGVILCVMNTEAFLRLGKLRLSDTLHDIERKLPYSISSYNDFEKFAAIYHDLLQTSDANLASVIVKSYKQLASNQYLLIIISADAIYCGIKIINK